MNYVSLCSGIGGIDLGLDRAGMTCVAQCEIDAACCGVLRKHWPDVLLHDDISTFTKDMLNGTTVDVVCGGTPCQDLSLAGRRAGLVGERSRLFYEFVRVADELAAPWILWENVPGVLSSNEGLDFSLVLRELTGFWPAVPADGWRSAGYCVGPRRGVTWRMLDAQYFGVPQRRRRVFLVGLSRVPFGASAQVLLESESSAGDPASSAEAGEDDAEGLGDGPEQRRGIGFRSDSSVAGTLGGGSGNRGWSDDMDRAGGLVLEKATQELVGHNWKGDLARTVTAPPRGHRYDLDTENFVVGSEEPWALNAGQENNWKQGVTPTITSSKGNPGAVTVPFRKSRRAHHDADYETWEADDVSNTLNLNDVGDARTTQAIVHPIDLRQATRTSGATGAGTPGTGFAGEGAPSYPVMTSAPPAASVGLWVRRLTPLECTRLQGFPDDWLASDADAEEAHSSQVLHGLWKAAGQEAREGWRTRVALAFLTPEVLLAGVHGGWVSWEVAGKCASARGKVAGETPWPEGFVRALRQYAQHRPSSHRRESFEQLARELGRSLPELPLERAQTVEALRCAGLWEEAQAKWPVRHARSTGQGSSEACCGLKVSDSAAYKQLGNAVAVVVSEWIGKRLVEVNDRI